jgi:hypothetical protein
MNNEQLTMNNVEIYDVYGRKVLEQKAEDRKQNEIDISHLQSGIYFVRVVFEGRDCVKKLVKQ